LILWKKGAAMRLRLLFLALCSVFRVRENAELGMTSSRGTESPLFHGTAFPLLAKTARNGAPRFKSASPPNNPDQVPKRNLARSTAIREGMTCGWRNFCTGKRQIRNRRRKARIVVSAPFVGGFLLVLPEIFAVTRNASMVIRVMAPLYCGVS
jgi:hypothetical protein